MESGISMGMGWGWLFWLLLIAGVILLVIVAIRLIGGGVARGTSSGVSDAVRDGGRARQLLDERYASSELSTEEYRERLRVLREGS